MISAHLSEQVRLARVAQRLTQAQLAEAAGTSRRTVVALEGGASVRLDTLDSIARALGLRLSVTLSPAEAD